MIQGFHATFGVGTIIAPWIVAPFVTHDTSSNTTDNTAIDSQTSMTNLSTSTVHAYGNESMVLNVAQALNTTLPPETKVQYAYSLLSIWFSVVAVLYFISYRMHLRENRQSTRNTNRNTQVEKAQVFEPMWYRISMLSLTGLRFGSYVALESKFAAYLTAFAVHGLDLKKRDGLAITSVFRTTFTISRVLNTCVAMCLRPSTMIILDLIVIMTTYTVLVFTVNHYYWAIWIGSSMAGLGMGSFFGASISWITQNVQMTGKAGSFINIGDVTGIMIMTFFIGHMFDSHGPMSFLYICMGDSFLISVFCILSYMLARFIRGIIVGLMLGSLMNKFYRSRSSSNIYMN